MLIVISFLLFFALTRGFSPVKNHIVSTGFLVKALLFLSVCHSSSPAFSQWDWHNQISDGFTRRAVAQSSSTIVTVGDGGLIQTSSDFHNWTVRESNTYQDFNDVLLYGSDFVAGGNFGTIFTSADGINWYPANIATTADITSLATNGTTLVAGLSNGNVLTTTNMVQWNTRVTGFTGGVENAVWAGTKFCLFGDFRSAVSNDGISWTLSPISFSSKITGAMWTGSAIVCVTDTANIYASLDGLIWTTGTGTSISSGAGMDFVGGNYYISGSNATPSATDGKILRSTDLLNWTLVLTVPNQICLGVVEVGSTLYAYGYFGLIGVSIDFGQNWITPGFNAPIGSSRLTQNPNGFVLTGREIAFANSTLTTISEVPGTEFQLEYWKDVASSETVFVAVGLRENGNGKAKRSLDGVTWVDAAIGLLSPSINSVTYADQFVAVGDSGLIITSPSGEIWTTVASSTAKDLLEIKWIKDRYWAVGREGAVVTSPDGNTWTPQSISGFTGPFIDVAGNGPVVMVMSPNKIFRSTDLVNWSQPPIPVDGISYNLNRVFWTGFQFMITLWEEGRAFFSDDGSSWTTSLYPGHSCIYDLVSDGDRVVATRESGAVISCDLPLESEWTNRPNTAIPDNDIDGITDTITGTDIGEIMKVEVRVKINHTYLGDLKIELVHGPTSQSIVLMDGPFTYEGNACSGNNMNVIFSDTAPLDVMRGCDTAFPAMTGLMRPMESLQPFTGLNSGDWTLIVRDQANQDTGTLKAWGVRVDLKQVYCEHDSLFFHAAGSPQSNWKYFWSKNGVTLPTRTNPLIIQNLSPGDEGLYQLRVASPCGDRVILEREVRIAPYFDVSPGSKAQGLQNITLNATLATCNASNFSWEDLVTHQIWNSVTSITPNPSVSTTYRAKLEDTVTGTIRSVDRTIIVAVVSSYFDYNGDGCNTVEDLHPLLPSWNGTIGFTDPSGDGRMNIIDYLHINLDDATCP